MRRCDDAEPWNVGKSGSYVRAAADSLFGSAVYRRSRVDFSSARVYCARTDSLLCQPQPRAGGAGPVQTAGSGLT